MRKTNYPTRQPLVPADKLVQWLDWHIRLCGYPPTSTEVAIHFGVARTTGCRWLCKLEDKGYIRRGKGLRNLTITYLPQ